MLEPIPRRMDHQHHFRYHPASRMDGFMLGQAETPIRQHPFPFNMQQFLPGNIMNNPQINRGISGFSGVLENIQKVLKLVETTTPLIQEYGPMIKNLPAMYRMVKALKEVDISDEPNQKEKTQQQTEEGNENVKESEQKETKNRTGLSTPKLYI